MLSTIYYELIQSHYIFISDKRWAYLGLQDYEAVRNGSQC